MTQTACTVREGFARVISYLHAAARSSPDCGETDVSNTRDCAALAGWCSAFTAVVTGVAEVAHGVAVAPKHSAAIEQARSASFNVSTGSNGTPILRPSTQRGRWRRRYHSKPVCALLYSTKLHSPPREDTEEKPYGSCRFALPCPPWSLGPPVIRNALFSVIAARARCRRSDPAGRASDARGPRPRPRETARPRRRRLRRRPRIPSQIAAGTSAQASSPRAKRA